MSAVARGLFYMRQRVSGRWPMVVLFVVWPLLGSGALTGPRLWRAELAQLTVLAVLAVALLWSVLRELGASRTASSFAELELGLLLLTGVYVLVAATGGPRSFLYPLVYAVVSFLMVVHRHRWVAYSLVAGLVALEVLAGWRLLARGDYALVAYHLTFIAFFAAGNALVLSTLVRRLRGDHSRRVDDELSKMRQDARDFRLIASPLSLDSRARTREDEELRLACAAVEGIHEQVFHTLDLLRSSMGLRSCVLLWCEQQETRPSARTPPRLVVKEMSTDSELMLEHPTLAGPGLLTSLIAEPKPLRLHALNSRRLPPYYRGPEQVSEFCAIPLMDGATLRGILCADRNADRPFSDAEASVLTRATDHISRSIAHERVFSAVERGKYEQEQFYRASEMLSEALTLEQVYDKTFEAVRAIASYDLAVLSAASPDGATQTVLAVSAPDGNQPWAELSERLARMTYSEPTSLVAMAVKNRHFMPAGGEMLDPETLVFDASVKLTAAKSVLVVPLTRGDQVLGSITLASSGTARYPQRTREMLRVISHHIGVSLQNARMYESMEQRATTDGLTGLTNHRAFQERLGQLHALCERNGGRYAIILTDIDHFKSINDTYGHPIGDQVLKRVAAIFTGRARKVDTVARYGGEEFVLVLPDTDGEGAEFVANKLREEIEACVMTSEHGNFQITISMGVAEYPADGRDRLSLVEKADQALYYCKEHGRNCVRRWSAVGG